MIGNNNRTRNAQQKSVADGDFVGYVEETEIGKVRALAEKSLVDELRAVGYEINSIYDLVGASYPYPKAIPILYRYLLLPFEDEVIHEGVARALGVPEAKYGWSILVSEYKKIKSRWSFVKDAIANSLRLLADENDFDEVVELLRDKQHGTSRICFLYVIKKSKRPDAQHILEELVTDDDLVLAISEMKPYWKKHNIALLEHWKTPLEKKRLKMLDDKLRDERRDFYESQ